MTSERLAQLFSLSGKRVWVAGHRGMVGAALLRRLQLEDCEVLVASHNQLDLRRQSDVDSWVSDRRPQAVFVAAAKVGGILENQSYPVDFLYDNLMIEANVIRASANANVAKLMFLGSSCIYPKFAQQPIREDALLTGSLEPTNEWYALAKIAGIKLCEAYRKQYNLDFNSAMPTNLYGPGDNFDLRSSHVIPALLCKAHEAKMTGAQKMTIWGSGTPRREFLYVDDCADAVVHLMKHYSGISHVNVGSGSDLRIDELARVVAKTVGFEGAIQNDPTKPDGTPRKLLDNRLLHSIGWVPRVALEEGLSLTYRWFLDHQSAG